MPRDGFCARLRVAMVALALVLASNPSPAQELACVHYGVREGLPGSMVTALAQSEDGLLWMAGSAGVICYDGAEFRTWRTRDGLLEDGATGIAAGAGGIVWILFADSGIQYIDRKGRVVTVPSGDVFQRDRPNELCPLESGELLVRGSKGYYRVAETGMTGPFQPGDRDTLSIDHILDAGDGGLLFATKDGVLLERDGVLSSLDLPYALMGSREVDRLARGRGGSVWCYGHLGVLVEWSEHGSAVYRLGVPRTHEPPTVNEMQVDGSGCLWFGAFEGLYRVAEGRVDYFAEDRGLASSWVNDVLVDRDDVVWIATEGGLAKMSQPAFQNYTAREGLPVSAVWTMAELPDGRVCMGTNSGLVVIDTTGTPRILTAADGLPEESIVDMEVGGDGSLWVLGFNGVFRWVEGRFVSYPYAPFRRIGLRTILPVGPSEVWVGTDEGVFALDPRSGDYRVHPVDSLIPGRPRVKRLERADGNDVWVLGASLWRWTEGGTLEDPRIPSGLVSGTIYAVHQAGGTVWLTTGAGLLVGEGGAWRLVELTDRVPFDAIRAADGSYWLGCSRGIACVRGDSVQVFDAYDGVALVEGNTDAALLAKDGRIWLGGRNVTVISPDRVRAPQDRAPLVVRAMVEDRIEWYPAAVTCGSRERSLELRLACPSFSNEREIIYRYRLPGIDAGWREVKNAGNIRYTSLPPGKFAFEAQARSTRGAWRGPTTVLPLRVTPAWWQTPASRAGFAILLVGLGFLGSHGRVKYLQAQRRKLSRLVAEQTEEIRRQRDHLAELATVDELTGLANRRKLSDRLELEIIRAGRFGRAVSLLIFDVDRFKAINDTSGHATGDAALKAIARRGSAVVRQTDMLARWGGDEFVLLMPETDQAQGLIISSRLKEAVETAAAEPTEPSFTISGGMATWIPAEGPATASDLMSRADTALYRAKGLGRNRICSEGG